MRSICMLLCCGLAWLTSCGDGLGPPRPRPLPALDSQPALTTPGPKSPRIANYRIVARLDEVARRIDGKLSATWKNTGASEVGRVPLHLYLNAFKNESTVFMRTSGGAVRGAEATANGWGWVELAGVSVGGVDITAQLSWPGPDETLVWVPLPAPVPVDGVVTLDIAFTAQLPRVFARTGYQGDFIMAGQWFPKLAARSGQPGFEMWQAEPFHAFSEFFADFGTYDVTLTVPRTHLIAATGVLVDATDNADGTRSLTYRAEDVHDFAWMADPYMEVLRGTARAGNADVDVRVVHRPAQRHFARRHLQAAIGAIEVMSEMFVPYPWSTMTIIDPPPDAVAGAGGVEYPTLVTTAGDAWWARPGVRVPEYVTIHEVGHNWFQGLLASNEAASPWLDEGVNEWANLEVMNALYGERGSLLSWQGIHGEMLRVRSAFELDRELPVAVATSAPAFPDSGAYFGTAYGKTMRALRTLQNLVGRDKFLVAMKRYAQTWAFRHPSPDDFFAAIEAEAGELDWFIDAAFHRVGTPALVIRSAQCQPRHPPRGVFGLGAERKVVGAKEAPSTSAWSCTVLVQNTGSVRLPVDVALQFADGTRLIERWDDRGQGAAWHRFEVERSSRLVEVVVDPERKLPLAEDSLGRSFRLTRNPDAAWRASARAGFWAQTAMSIFGL